MYLLDFDICLQFLEGGNRTVADRLRGQRPADIALSSLTKAALLSRARSSGRIEEKLDTLNRFFAPLTILPFDDRCAEEYGQVDALLPPHQAEITAEDRVNAATARAHDATLVTRNAGRFSQVAGLRLADWQE